MKYAYLITARLKSSRLREKILLDLNGKTILDHVIERCKKVVGTDEVILCTSTNTQDSVLFDYALKHGIKFYAGSEDDVLTRLRDAALYYGVDGFLSITADNPLHSFYCGTVILDQVKKFNFDFVFTEGLPIGIAPYYLNTKALQVAIKMKEDSNTEIWGPFCKRKEFFNLGNLIVKNYSIPSSNRITCDCPDDYKLFRYIYAHFDTGMLPSIFQLEDLYLENPNLFTINSNIKQQGVSKEILERITTDFNNNIEQGESYARSIGHKLIPNNTIIEIEF